MTTATEPDKWAPGTFSTQSIRDRLVELLDVIRKRGEIDAAAGRAFCASEMAEAAHITVLLVELLDNTITAHAASIKALETAAAYHRGNAR